MRQKKALQTAPSEAGSYRKFFYKKNITARIAGAVCFTLLFVAGFITLLIFSTTAGRIFFSITGFLFLLIFIPELKKNPFVKFVIIKNGTLELYNSKEKEIRHYSIIYDLKTVNLLSEDKTFFLDYKNTRFGSYSFYPFCFKEPEVLISELETILQADFNEAFSPFKNNKKK